MAPPDTTSDSDSDDNGEQFDTAAEWHDNPRDASAAQKDLIIELGAGEVSRTIASLAEEADVSEDWTGQLLKDGINKGHVTRERVGLRHEYQLTEEGKDAFVAWVDEYPKQPERYTGSEETNGVNDVTERGNVRVRGHVDARTPPAQSITERPHRDDDTDTVTLTLPADAVFELLHRGVVPEGTKKEIYDQIRES